MGDRLATIDMSRKEGAAVPLFGGESSHLTQCGQGGRDQHAKFHVDLRTSGRDIAA